MIEEERGQGFIVWWLNYSLRKVRTPGLELLLQLSYSFHIEKYPIQ